MPTNTVRGGVDAYAFEGKPKKNFRKAKWLRVAQGDSLAFIRMKSPAPRGATILSAELIMEQATAADPGSYTITARATDHWKVDEVTWDHQPAVGGATSALTKSNPGAGTLWRWDVTELLQGVSSGNPELGIRLASDNADLIRLFSLNASKQRPRLVVTWTTAPEAPTMLKPSYGYISAAKPTLVFDYTDHAGSTTLVACQVQIDAANIFTSGVDWDTATAYPNGVPVEIPQLNLSDTTYPGLAEGATTYWRVRVKDGDGLWSKWSDSVPLSRYMKGVVTILNPAPPTTEFPDPFVSEFTPPILWSFNFDQTHFRVTIAKASAPNKLLHDSGKKKSDQNAYTIPKRILKDGVKYVVTVQCWDNIGREAAPEDPVYAHSSREFIVDFDPTIDAPNFLTVVASNIRAPWVDLCFGRDDLPDSWTILRDGVPIDTDVLPGDLELGEVIGGLQSYIYRDWSARPEVKHTYKVRAEVNGKLSEGGPTIDYTPPGVAIWLADPSTGQEILMGGKGIETERTDNAETWNILGGTGVVRSVMGANGLSGSVSNLMVRTRDGFEWQDLEEDLNDFFGRINDEYRLVWGTQNIPVVLLDGRVVPHDDTVTGDPRLAVYFRWYQSDEFPIEVQV